MPRQKTLDLYVVYENPSDFPGCFVVRKWRGTMPECEPLAVGRSLDEARNAIPNVLSHACPSFLIRSRDSITFHTAWVIRYGVRSITMSS